jgi:hypothetical protein
LPTIKPTPTELIRILVIIAIASLLFFILIIFILAMLIKSHRCHLSSISEDKVSSSSFAQSISTAMSADFPQEIYQYKPPSNLSNHYSKPRLIPGLVPQTNLSPRFYRQRRTPLYIQSPSINHGANKRIHRPIITHLKNGDVIISA